MPEDPGHYPTLYVLARLWQIERQENGHHEHRLGDVFDLELPGTEPLFMTTTAASCNDPYSR